MKKPLIGLCPIGKFVFSHQDAMRYKRLLQEYFTEWGIDYVDLEDVLPDGMVRDQKHVEPVVRHFASKRIDALFIPHCNFGTEGAAGMIAKQCGVPTLLWGPRDDTPLADGTRLRDSLCGVLATSGVLNTLQVPFTYIKNCEIDSADFQDGVDRFVRVAGSVKAIREMRIGQVGQRIDFFWSTFVNEADLLQRFGIQIQPIDLVKVIRDIKERTEQERARYEAELAEHRNWIRFNHYRDDTTILYNYAFRDIMLELAEEHDLSGVALQSFDSIQQELGAGLSFGSSLIGDAGLPISPESDVYAAISSVLLEATTHGIGASENLGPSFIPDITIRHPENPNGILLWHADAPLKLRANDEVKVDLPWILTGQPTGLVHMKLKDGPLTLCRFAGDANNGYRLGFGQGQTIEGPYTQEFYAWMEVSDWTAWEEHLVRGPYIHHCSCVYGHHADALKEVARYLPEITFEDFDAEASVARRVVPTTDIMESSQEVSSSNGTGKHCHYRPSVASQDENPETV